MEETITRTLTSARSRLTGVTGLLLAGTDGRPVAHSLEADAAGSTSAIAASSLQLARRLGDLLGTGALEEVTVRTTDGYVILDAVGDRWLLVALTVRSANVPRIILAFRDLAPELVQRLD